MSQYNKNGFDEESFLKYIENGSSEETLAEILSGVVDFTEKHHSVSLDELAYTVSDMTGIDFEEVIRFCSDEILTNSAQDIKSSMPEILVSDEDYENGFAKDSFILYAENTWALNLEDLLQNTLETLYQYDNVSRDQLAESICEITEAPFESVLRFCSEDILTRDSISKKEEDSHSFDEIELD